MYCYTASFIFWSGGNQLQKLHAPGSGLKILLLIIFFWNFFPGMYIYSLRKCAHNNNEQAINKKRRRAYSFMPWTLMWTLIIFTTQTLYFSQKETLYSILDHATLRFIFLLSIQQQNNRLLIIIIYK